MTAGGSVVMVANPFEPVNSRQVIRLPAPVTVRGYLDQRGIGEFARPTVCVVNDGAVLRADWDRVEIGPGDVCCFIALPAGGGGGGKNPLKTILTIAIMVVAFVVAPELAPYIGSAFAEVGIGLTWEVASAIGSGLISVAGNVLLNAVIPPPKPSVPSLSWGGSGNVPAPSPTYTLQSQGNQARLGQPIPVGFGRHLSYPDFATEPYQEYEDNEQVVYQLHVVGQGEYDIEASRIEDTPLSSFEEIETQIVPPGGTVTLFDPNVVTSPEVSGQELTAPNMVDEGGDGYIGPFVVVPADAVATHLGFDMVMARGLYATNQATGNLVNKTIAWDLEARAIDSAGLPTSSWFLLGSESVTDKTTTALRFSYKYAVPPGRYEVRGLRTDDKTDSATVGHEVRWGQARAYLQGDLDFSGLTLYAVKARATDNLSQRSSRLLNLIWTRKLPVWDSVTGWSDPQPTRSIVWAAADVLRAEYGGELSDGRLPLVDMAALDAELDARGNFFDGLFDTQTTVWDAITRIMRCGRAVPVQQGGRVRFFRDKPQSIPTAMFGPRNIVKGSFSIEFLMPGEDTADAVTVDFFSAATWKPDDVTGAVADSIADRPAKVTLFGCTAAAHAQEEADYMAAANRYRRVLVRFRTELDGMVPTYGDLIAVTHPMARWGQGGEVVAWDQAAGVLTLSEPLDWTEGVAHYLALRHRDGSVAGVYEVADVPADEPKVHLVDTLESFAPYTGGGEEKTYYSFGPTDQWSKLCRLLAMRPRGGQVEIFAVVEDPRVHVN